jgi:hypothetical protein
MGTVAIVAAVAGVYTWDGGWKTAGPVVIMAPSMTFTGMLPNADGSATFEGSVTVTDASANAYVWSGSWQM